MAVPDTEQEQNFIIEQEEQPADAAPKLTRKEKKPKTPDLKEAEVAVSNEDEFDLSGISHKTKSREDIIAEAESAAFAEE